MTSRESDTVSQLGTACHSGVGLSTDSKVLKAELKALKSRKAEIARGFKSVEPDSDQREALIADMTAVSERIKAVEDALKPSRSQPAVQAYQETKAPPFYRISNESEYTQPFQLRELNSEEYDAWFQFVRDETAAPLYMHRSWGGLIQKSFGHPTRIWVAMTPEGRIVGGVPLTFFSSRLFGRFAVSVPYFNYGGVLSPYWNVAKALLTGLQKVAHQEQLTHIEVRTMQDGLWPNSSDRKVSMVLPLPETLEALGRQLGSKVRAQSKKAEEHHPTVAFGGLELLDDFYRVFARNMRDLGTPVYAKSWFANVLSEPGLAATLVVVKVRGRAVSAGFLLGHGPMLEIPWASTIRPANALNTNMWMYRQILDYAVSEGYEFFDFGRSTRGAGTYHFKKQWGAKPYEHHWYYITPDHSKPPELNPDNPKFRLMIALWKRMPVWLSRLVGPPIVKHLP